MSQKSQVSRIVFVTAVVIVVVFVFVFFLVGSCFLITMNKSKRSQVSKTAL